MTYNISKRICTETWREFGGGKLWKRRKQKLKNLLSQETLKPAEVIARTALHAGGVLNATGATGTAGNCARRC